MGLSLSHVIFFKLILRERGKDREREIEREKEELIQKNSDLSFFLFMHSLVDSCKYPDWGSNPQP